MRLKRATIKGCNIKVSSVGAIVAHNFEALVLRVGTLRVSSISIRSSLVDLFRSHFILSIEAISLSDHPG